jgi:hypothetical protein
MVSGGIVGQFRRIVGYEGVGDAQQTRVGNRPGVKSGREGQKFRLGSGKNILAHNYGSFLPL